MIPLNEPWSVYERRVADLQRREARMRFSIGFIFGLGFAIAFAGVLMLIDILRF